MRIIYRIRQFWHFITDSSLANNFSQVNAVLTERQIDLFSHLAPGERAHSLRVYHYLLDRGESDPDLMVAALLHDIGKSCHRLRIWERILIVIMQFLFPSLTSKWGEELDIQSIGHSDWRRGFIIANKHPIWGAELIAKNGASQRIVKLVREHQKLSPEDLSIEENILLKKIQIADFNC